MVTRIDKIIFSASFDARTAPGDLKRLAVLADDAGLDFIVLENPDALITASWLMSATMRLGLVPAISAIYDQPFHTARALSAMDILSGGRIGWMPRLAGYDKQARHFGTAPPLPPSEAGAKAAEFVAATEALWDSWDADALVIDKESAVYLDSGKIRRVDFRGDYFRVMGPLNSARPPQGHPVLLRDADEPSRIQADVLLISATTPSDAEQRADALRNAGPARILVKAPCAGDFSQSADFVEEWHEAAACDGFHVPPQGLRNFLECVVPELHRRGLITPPGLGESLRDRLGLPIPVNPYSRPTNGEGA